MKHLRVVSRTPAKAADDDVTTGQILTFIVNILSVVATTLTGKEAADQAAGGGGE